jgi:REP element-mobilizing transposase RayT
LPIAKECDRETSTIGKFQAMARLLRIEYSGAFYHITSRGNDRKAVFKSDRDLGPSSVSQASRRIALKRSKDQKLNKIVKRIEKNIS